MGSLSELEIETTANRFVSKIESGDCSPLTAELNALSGRDRLAVARAMDKINDKHRLEHPQLGLPDIVLLELKLSGAGQVKSEHLEAEQLLDMQLLKPTGVVDLYDSPNDRPKTYQGGSPDRPAIDTERLSKELLPSLLQAREFERAKDYSNARASYEHAINEADRITPNSRAVFEHEIVRIQDRMEGAVLNDAEYNALKSTRNKLIELMYAPALTRLELAALEHRLGNTQAAKTLSKHADQLSANWQGTTFESAPVGFEQAKLESRCGNHQLARELVEKVLLPHRHLWSNDPGVATVLDEIGNGKINAATWRYMQDVVMYLKCRPRK
jgi:hypothetical protein